MIMDLLSWAIGWLFGVFGFVMAGYYRAKAKDAENALEDVVKANDVKNKIRTDDDERARIRKLYEQE